MTEMMTDPDDIALADAPAIREIDTTGAAVAVTWADGVRAGFHPLWLRDNCRCTACRHPQAWEKTSDILDIEAAVQPAEVRLEEDALAVTWAPDGHESRFPAHWLYRHAPAVREATTRRDAPVLWRSDIGDALPEAECAAVVNTEAGLRDWLRQLRTHGVSIIRNTPCEEDQLFRVAGRIAYLRETNFGVDFAVVSVPDPVNVAYTAIDLKAHTDLANRETPPGIQFFHCLEFSATGGESLLVDGFAVAEELRRTDPDAFEMLSTVPVGYRFHDRDWDLRWRAPVIRLGPEGGYEEIRFSRQLEAAPDLDGETLVALHRAKQAFVRLTRDPAFELQLRLQPGDLLAFQNRRVLHGRASFDPRSGRRRFQGCYVDADEAWSRLRVLERPAA